MSGMHDLRVDPATAAGATASVQPVTPSPAQDRHAREADARAQRHEPAASTGGQLRSAYAEFFVDPDTEDVVLHIRDANTNEVIRQIPSPEILSMTQYLRNYADALARRRAVSQAQAGL